MYTYKYIEMKYKNKVGMDIFLEERNSLTEC